MYPNCSHFEHNCFPLIRLHVRADLQVKKSYEAKRAKRKAQGRTDRSWRLARLPMEVRGFRLSTCHDARVVNMSRCTA